MSIGIWGLIHLIGHIFMMQMDSFNFDSGLELISVPNHSRFIQHFVLVPKCPLELVV